MAATRALGGSRALSVSGAGGGLVRSGKPRVTLALSLGAWRLSRQRPLHSTGADQAQRWLLTVLLPWKHRSLLRALEAQACPQPGLKPLVGVGHSWAAKMFAGTLSGVTPTDT